jgi:hypothetical protein
MLGIEGDMRIAARLSAANHPAPQVWANLKIGNTFS